MGGGGASLLPVPWRKHVASTVQARGAALVPLQVGGGFAVWLRSSPYLPCGRDPGGPLVGACTARAPFGHGRVVRPAPSLRCLPTLPRCPWGGVRVPLPSSPTLGGAVVCWGGGGAPLSSSLCSTHVVGTTQARRKHRARLQWGGGFPFGAPIPPRSGTSPASLAGPCRPGLPPYVAVLVPVFSLSSRGALVCFVLCFFFLRLFARRPSLPLARWCVLCPPPPPCPLAASSLSSPLSWVGGGEVAGGGASSLSVLWRKHVASTAQARGAALVPLQGGGGACRVAPVVALPTLRSHPRCPPRWGLHGACFLRARSCGPSRTLSPLPPHLAALSSGEGGGAVRPSLPSSPTLGGPEVCGGGGGHIYIYYYTPLPLNLANKQATTSKQALLLTVLAIAPPHRSGLYSTLAIVEPRWCPCQIQVYSQKLSGGGPGRGRQVGKCPPKFAQFWAKNSHFSPKTAPKPGRNAQMKGYGEYTARAA